MEVDFKSMDNPVFDFWNKLMVDMWSKCAMPVGNPFTWFTQPDKMKGPWQIPFNTTQAIFDSLAAFTGDKKYVAGDGESLAELVSNLMQPGLEGYLELQKKWLDNLQKGSSPLLDIESLSHAQLIWLESIRKLPGLIRNAGASGSSHDLLVKYTAFCAKMSELLYQLYLPMDKASKALVETLGDIDTEGRVPQNIEEASGVWFSVLESSYLDLFKSPGYTRLLHETADAYEQYCQIRRQVHGPSKAGPKPQDKSVEALSDEISKLREKLEELLQRVDFQTGQPTGERVKGGERETG
jgi:hypothetical protein